MLRINRTRSEYVARYEELIDRYNDGSSTIDDLFAKLLALCRDLDAEEQRHVREHLSEDELVIFDLLTRPDPALTGDERDAVKRVVRLLRERLHALLAPGWRERVTARAAVKQAVDGILDMELQRVYTPEIFAAKSGMVFQHLIDQAGAPRSVG